nr:MAG TPA: hypothetical protein [Caudoviricetes sp.]
MLGSFILITNTKQSITLILIRILLNKRKTKRL